VLFLSIAALVVGYLLLIPFLPTFLRLIGTPEEFVAIGTPYFSVVIVATAVNFLNTVYISIEKSRGNTQRIMRLNIFSMVLKLVLTAFFIYMLKGSVFMIGLATLLTYLVVFAFALYNLSDRDSAFAFSYSRKGKRKDFLPMCRISFPLIVEKAAFAMGKTVVNSMVALYGALMVGALGVSTSVTGLTTMMQGGYNDSASAIIAQNAGGGKASRVVKIYVAALTISLISSILGTIILLFFSNPLIHLFALSRSGADHNFELMIHSVFRYDIMSCIPLSVSGAGCALLLGVGKTKLSLLVSMCRIFVFRIPLLYFLQNYTLLGSASVGIMMVASNSAVAVLATILALFQLKKREKKLH